MANNSELIPTEFDCLQTELGFDVVDADRSRHFDNAMVVLSNQALRIRFSRDRGDICVEVACDPTKPAEWYDLDLIRALVLGGDPAQWADWAALAGFLRRHHAIVAQLFSKQQVDATSARLHALQQERFNKMFPRAISD